MSGKNGLVVVRGGGDLATGVIQKLHRAGIPVLVLEVEKPTAIRRTVALSEAVYEGQVKVEDVQGQMIMQIGDIEKAHDLGVVPVLIDPAAACIAQLKPVAVVDAILAKKNLGTNRSMAPITIAMGPGFCAGRDVDAVIETMRGHNLGRLLLEGSAQPNTGMPGEIGGKSTQRVVRAPADGVVLPQKQIGDIVEQGEALLTVDNSEVKAPFRGLVRGMIRKGYPAHKEMKIGDVDPRIDVDWNTISDKARCLGGAVLEAYLYLKRNQ